jgi:hypothetical protein
VSGRQQAIPYNQILASLPHGLCVVDGKVRPRHSSKSLGHPQGFCPVQEIRLGNWLPGMPHRYAEFVAARVEGLAQEGEKE